MYWDNCEYPSVEAPISAFFGTAYDENFVDRDGKYAVLNSAKILVAPGRGLNCYWEMPFKKHCRITMENRGEKDQDLYYIITGCHCEVPDEVGYFHASYRQEHPIQKGRSYTIIDGIQGKGQFVGVTLATGMNGNNTCWVEGEARMYIDDDKYPSIHYTGTEDPFTIQAQRIISAAPTALEMMFKSNPIRLTAAFTAECTPSTVITVNFITASRDFCYTASTSLTRFILRPNSA